MIIMSSYENMTITCKDGYTLNAKFYPSQGDTTHLPILLCPATGITMNFYHSFCEWLATQNFHVMVFDFRGIGQSLYTELKKSEASIQDWGILDIPAAINSLLSKTQQQQINLIGHSAGGQLLGITPNFQKVARLIAIAGSTGHVKGLKGRTKKMAPVMFNVVFPVSIALKGYGATQMLGMGENLPKNVAKQWAQFCSKPGYVINAIGKTIFDDYHQQIQCPITVIYASDDEIATEANVNDLLRLYPNAKTDKIELQPAQYDQKAIGHMLMFKKSHHQIWSVIADQIAA